MAKSNFFGILNIYKPKGITSFDVVAKLRKILNTKKIGHTGTLDPLAQGVLPICVGEATRIIEFLPTGKSYRAFAKLGLTSNTYDTEGEIVETKNFSVSKEEVETVLKTFEGEIEQTPPIFSAIKVKGKKLYEYARKNQDVEIPKRKVTISKIEVVDWQEGENPIVVFDVDCSGGTYIRSIIHDLGQKLGCGAIMVDLIRTKANDFVLEKAQPLETLTQENAAFLDPLEVVELPEIKIEEDGIKKLIWGQSFDTTEERDSCVKISYNEKMVAIAEQKGRIVSPKKVFCRKEDFSFF